MICKKCGTENPEENKFCSKCGKKLKSKNKMDSKNKKVIIIVSIILVLALIVTSILLFINNKNKEIYKSATNSFVQLDFKKAYSQFEEIENYKNAKQMKETCISQAEETASSFVETKDYEKAIELYSFVGEHKDMSETIISLKEQYIKYLLDENNEEQAYNYLPNFPEISPELLNKTQVKYIMRLIYNEQHEKGFELMNSLENLTEDNKTDIITTYIKFSAKEKAYSSLYNSMRNPSSLKVKSTSYTISCNEDGEEYKGGYDKETGKFEIQVHFSFSGQNGFGGMTSSRKTFIYSGNINLETMQLSLSYKMSY